MPTYAVTPHDTAARQLSVNYGVTAVLAPDVSSTDEMLGQMERVLVEGGYMKKGQLVVFLAGQPVGRPGTTEPDEAAPDRGRVNKCKRFVCDSDARYPQMGNPLTARI